MSLYAWNEINWWALWVSGMTYQPYSKHNNTPNLQKAKIFGFDPAFLSHFRPWERTNRVYGLLLRPVRVLLFYFSLSLRHLIMKWSTTRLYEEYANSIPPFLNCSTNIIKNYLHYPWLFAFTCIFFNKNLYQPALNSTNIRWMLPGPAKVMCII